MGNIDIKVKISTLWIVVMLNMIFADIFLIMIELVNKNTIDITMDVKVTMAIAAVVTNIPILMIYYSRVLEPKINRVLNMIAAVSTIIFIIGGGSIMPHYVIIASIEVVCLILIFKESWKWQN